jgi:DHA2 family multidrug resistance protein
LHHGFNGIAAKNFQLLSASFDRVNQQLTKITPSQLTEILQNQALMVSFKEVYGSLVIASIGCFIAFLLYKYPYSPLKVLYPRMRTIRKMLRKEIAQ